MFNSNWLYKFAVRGLLIGAILWTGTALSQEPGGQPNSPTKTTQQDQPAKAKKGPPESPVPPALAPKEQIPAGVQQETSTGSNSHADNDLKAQRRMAVAAEELLKITETQTVVISIEAALLAITIFFTAWAAVAASKAAGAADKAVKVTSNTAERQLRAYVGVISVDMTWEPNNILATVTLKNVGQTPAKKLTVWNAWETGENIDFIDSGEESRKGPSRDIFPSGDVKIEIPIRFRDSKIRDFVWDRKAPLYIWGGIVYVDIFGDDRATKFRAVFDKKVTVHGTSYGLVACNEGNECT